MTFPCCNLFSINISIIRMWQFHKYSSGYMCKKKRIVRLALCLLLLNLSCTCWAANVHVQVQSWCETFCRVRVIETVMDRKERSKSFWLQCLFLLPDDLWIYHTSHFFSSHGTYFTLEKFQGTPPNGYVKYVQDCEFQVTDSRLNLALF